MAEDDFTAVAVHTQADIHVAGTETARVAQHAVREKKLELQGESGQMPVRIDSLNAKSDAMQVSAFSELDVLIKNDAASDHLGSLPALERRNTVAARQGCDSRGGNNGVALVERRVITVAVVFLDIVGYTRQSDSMQIAVKQKFNQLLTRSMGVLAPEESLILDTGDGAAIGFLQHPTEAMAMAMRFCAELPAGGETDSLPVRIGINLGPVSLLRDINGQINMLGDGINSAQRVMSFAGKNQIYVSRAYVDFVSSLSDEYADLFHYRGALQDKHGREYQVYELLSVAGAEEESASIPVDAFNFDAFNLEMSSTPEVVKLPEQFAAQRIKEDASLKQLTSVEPYATVNLPEILPESLPENLPDISPEPVVQAEAFVSCEVATPVEKKPPAAPVIPVDKVVLVYDRPSWGKRVAGLFILLLLVLFVVPFVWPMQNYVAGIEQRLSGNLHQPVHIGHLAGRILPAPELTLTDVSIGRTGEIQIPRVQVNFAFSALYGQIKVIHSVELDRVQVQGAGLPEVVVWLQKIAGDTLHPISRVVFKHGQLEADGVSFSTVDARLNFDAAGKFLSANFDANEHKLALQIRAVPPDKLQLAVTLHDSALPSLPGWTFDTFKAAGELSGDELHLISLEGLIRGGMLTGSANINWQKGWRVQGKLVATSMPLQHVSKLLAGKADGSADFQMQAENLAKLADTAIVTGAFYARKGLINGVDIVETTRLYSHENLPGGRTHFDEMSSRFSYAHGDYRFDQLKLKDSILKAEGRLTIKGSALSGTISANLAMRAGTVALKIGGTTASPSLQLSP